MNSCYITLTIGLILAFQVNALSQSNFPELIGDRPDMTESSSTIPPRFMQIETGIDYASFSTDNSILQGYELLPAALVRIGLLNRLELRFETGYSLTNTSILGNINYTTQGLVPFSTGFKYNFNTPDKALIPQISFIGMVSFGQLASGIYHSQDIDLIAIGTFESEITDALGIGCNLGIESNEGRENITYIATIAAGYAISNKLNCFAEFASFSSTINTQRYFNAGLTYQYNKNIQFDIYGNKGLSPSTANYHFGLGFILLFGL